MQNQQLLLAFASGNKEEAFRLLKIVKDPRKVKGSIGWTLLHHAAVHGWTDIVELNTSTMYDVNCRDDINWTPVHFASYCFCVLYIIVIIDQDQKEINYYL